MANHITNQDVRQANRARVLRQVVASTETTRARLAVACGLSTATVGNVASDLIAEGTVEETGFVPSRGGRRIARLAVRPAGGRLIGADVGEQALTVELFDLALNKLDSEYLNISRRVAQPEAAGTALGQAIRIILYRNRSADIPTLGLGLGLGLPGTVETDGDAITIFAESLGWEPTELHRLSGGFDFPTFAGNGARTLANAESLFGAAKGTDHSIVALIGHGQIDQSTRTASLKRPGSQFSLEASSFGQDAVTLGAAVLPLERVIEGHIQVARVL